MQENIIGKTYTRPWGTYKTLELDKGYQVKIITVKPGGELSLQKHFKRVEHWVIVKGQPTITIGKETKSYNVNDTVYIPKEIPHRMENAIKQNFQTDNLISLDDGKSKATIQLTDSGKGNDLLKLAVDSVSVNSFREVLPTMNEVFIKAVDENKNKKENV